jgi:iron complex transport system ATP-binding protein
VIDDLRARLESIAGNGDRLESLVGDGAAVDTSSGAGDSLDSDGQLMPERSRATGTDPVVDVADVSITLGEVAALEDVSVEAEAGEFLGIIGPNGAGKTTLLRTISGVLKPDSGSIRVDGQDIGGLSSRAVSRLVAVVPQETNLAFDFDVREIVSMGRTPYRKRLSWGDRPDEVVVDRALAETRIEDLADRAISEVSGGERQRVLLARALAQDTPVLLLDEPTASLDINHQVRTLEMVRSLVDEGGKTVMAPIHDLNLAAHYCDRLLLLADGRRTALGPPESVLTESNLESAFGTEAIVTNHPVTGSVYVMALPAGAIETTKPPVHVIGGGGTAARLLYLLSAAGYEVTTGALNEGDADLETARLLGIDAVTLEPYSPIDDATYERVLERVREAAVTVVADVEIGEGNLPNLRAACEAEEVVVVADRPFDERNYTGVRGADLYESLVEAGTETQSAELLRTLEELVADGDASEAESGDAVEQTGP